MERLTLTISDNNNLKCSVVDLLESSNSFYNLALDLANHTDNDAGLVEPDDLAKFMEYLDEDVTYYMAELLYMVRFAMDNVTFDN